MGVGTTSKGDQLAYKARQTNAIKRSEYLHPLLDRSQEFVVSAFESTEVISQTSLPNGFE
jgi:hypothetical protein